MFTVESLQQYPGAVKALTGLPAEEFWSLVDAVGRGGAVAAGAARPPARHRQGVCCRGDVRDCRKHEAA